MQIAMRGKLFLQTFLFLLFLFTPTAPLLSITKECYWAFLCTPLTGIYCPGCAIWHDSVGKFQAGREPRRSREKEGSTGGRCSTSPWPAAPGACGAANTPKPPPRDRSAPPPETRCRGGSGTCEGAGGNHLHKKTASAAGEEETSPKFGSDDVAL